MLDLLFFAGIEGGKKDQSGIKVERGKREGSAICCKEGAGSLCNGRKKNRPKQGKEEEEEEEAHSFSV